ncbi:hypothetical protein EXN66_Car018840 [Channa argus]|uniref:Uncharacterized protein n=1 Tax=Channa argus TaxID=215402 RepID=A0A6G1QKS4_CHAAH|nr:hypothetical protein EXN66_Car018840 [Channa argus]
MQTFMVMNSSHSFSIFSPLPLKACHFQQQHLPPPPRPEALLKPHLSTPHVDSSFT